MLTRPFSGDRALPAAPDPGECAHGARGHAPPVTARYTIVTIVNI